MHKDKNISWLFKKTIASMMAVSLVANPLIAFAEDNPEENTSIDERQLTSEDEKVSDLDTTNNYEDESDSQDEPVIIGLLLAVPVTESESESTGQIVSDTNEEMNGGDEALTSSNEGVQEISEVVTSSGEGVQETSEAVIFSGEEGQEVGEGLVSSSEENQVAEENTSIASENAPVAEASAAPTNETALADETSQVPAIEEKSVVENTPVVAGDVIQTEEPVTYASVVPTSETKLAEESVAQAPQVPVEEKEAVIEAVLALASENETVASDQASANDAPTANTATESAIVLTSGQPSVLDEIVSMPNNIYNHQLAVLSAELSSKAYSEDGSGVAAYLKSYGFDQDSIRSYNYGDAYAYTLAVKDYYGTGASENTKILVMDARGTSTLEELIADVYTTPDVDYDGYKVFTAADTFLNEIKKNLDSFLTEDNHYKIVSTGHSLGGAAANLFAAVETRKGQSEVYCYTFGAIDSVQSLVPGQTILEGFENIHNIYNDLDTFSPSQYGSYLLGGAGSKYGKFGHMDAYSAEHRTPEQQDDWAVVQIYDHVNHNMDFYVTDTQNKKYSCFEEPDRKDKHDDEEQDNSSENRTQDTSDNGSVIKMPKDLGNVILNAHNKKAITGTVTDKNDNFAQNIKILAAGMKAQVIYNATSQELGVEGVSLQNILTFKDGEGHVIVMMELSNTSGKDISVGIDSLVADGSNTNVTPWKSAIIPNGKRYVIAIPLDSIISNYVNSTMHIHIYGSDNAEIATTKEIRVTAEK